MNIEGFVGLIPFMKVGLGNASVGLFVYLFGCTLFRNCVKEVCLLVVVLN